MSKLRSFAVLLALFAPWLLASPSSQAETEFVLPDTSRWSAEERALLNLERARSLAIASHDSLFLRQLYADDFRGVTALGMAVDRETLLEVFQRDDPSTTFLIDELAVRLLGKRRDTAVVTGRLTTRRVGGDVVARSRFLHSYERRGGRWRLVFGQGTLLRPPAEAEPSSRAAP